jgi:hypothetical protein
MDQNTKIILGIVLLGGAYYLYTRKKPEAVVNKRIGEIDRGYSVKTIDNSKLPKWRLKRDISRLYPEFGKVFVERMEADLG